MLVILALTALSLLLSQPAATLPPAQDIAAAKAWLTRLQHLSFATNREYCGYLGYMPDGTIAFSDIVRGGHDGCTPVLSNPDLILIASLHTHGAYDPEVPAEFPTSLDISSDLREGVNGYISTPGGRLWYVDATSAVAIQLCGLRCLPQDPAFHAGDDGKLRHSYTRRQLRQIEMLD